MVTQITDKLRQQTLEEISSTAKQIQSEQLKKALQGRCVDAFGKSSETSQHRNRTGRNIKFKPFGDDGLEGSMAVSTLTGRSNTYPPAKKRLCHSLSHLNENHGAKPSWNPEPSSIWTPVKPSKGDRANPTNSRSLEFTDKETSSWSTPPESPIPRPVSANSALEDSRFFPLRLSSEERDSRSRFNSSCFVKTSQAKQNTNLCTSLSRSHSQPSFSSVVNNNLKRRLSEEDIPRPALDFDKMKARSFANTNHRKRTAKPPKYSSRRHGSVSPKTPNSSKSVQTSGSLTVSVDMDSSLMITPTASPTSMGDLKTFESKKCGQQEDENANTRLQSFTEQKCMFVDLDVKLIEEDGTLTDNEMQNTTVI